MSVVFYISGHGLGHSARQIEIIRELRAAEPDVRVVVRTSAPKWLFDSTAPAIEFHDVVVDTGVVQIDSLRLDEDATVRAAALFYQDFDRRAADEAAVLRRLDAAVVVGDVPPLAFAAAARAGIPSIAIANFTWDWIYAAYPAFTHAAPQVIPTIAAAYTSATHTLRLPLHGGFESMPDVIDIPLVARHSGREPSDTRRLLGADRRRPLVLASFGGYGVDLPLDALRQSARFTVLAPRDPPAGLRYEDLVAAADVVVSKPGYGIVSECVANDAALLYTSRGRFVEYDVFVAGMPSLLRCRYLPQEDLLAGRWADAIESLLAQPAPPERPRTDGARIAARHVLQALH